ncbi:MAG: hypothetical protein R2748_11760 [Bryobacterales bacterium]
MRRIDSFSPFAIFEQESPNQPELRGIGLTATPVVQGNGRIDIQLAATVKNVGGVDADAVKSASRGASTAARLPKTLAARST